MEYRRAKAATCPFQQSISTLERLTPKVPGEWVSKESGQPWVILAPASHGGSPGTRCSCKSGAGWLVEGSLPFPPGIPKLSVTCCGWFPLTEAKTRGWGAGSDLFALSGLPEKGSERRWSQVFLKGAYCNIQGQPAGQEKVRLSGRTVHSEAS